MTNSAPARRTTRRYIILLVLVALLFGGWSAVWYVAAGKAQATLEGWRAREAQAGRIFDCGSQSIGGYPFRFEFHCEQPSALFQSSQPPLEVKAGGVLVASQIYQPTLLISEFYGPLAVSAPGQPPDLVMNWKLFQSSVRGTPSAPERVALVFERPVVETMTNGAARTIWRAEHAELHGRLIEGTVNVNPVIEVTVRVNKALAPDLRALAAQPADAMFNTVLRGLSDFSLKPWPERFRQVQAANGSIEVVQARVQQGVTIAVGSGSLSISPAGRPQGQLSLTVAGLEPFLKAINAEHIVQTSPTVDRLAGALDRLSPGLGQVARQQVGANLSAGINMLGQQTTLEGRPAVTLPLRFDDGRMYLGPIPLGDAPALF